MRNGKSRLGMVVNQELYIIVLWTITIHNIYGAAASMWYDDT